MRRHDRADYGAGRADLIGCDLIMASGRRFPAALVSALHASKILGIRAGMGDHRFIGIWVVVVDGHVFVRSYTLTPEGWYETLRADPRGTIQVGTRKVAVRAVPVRSARTKNAVDRAYAEKYSTPGSLKYVRGFRLPKRQASTMELVPRRSR
jgi:hypothetical protein